jgi:hypothetical protein
VAAPRQHTPVNLAQLILLAVLVEVERVLTKVAEHLVRPPQMEQKILAVEAARQVTAVQASSSFATNSDSFNRSIIKWHIT